MTRSVGSAQFVCTIALLACAAAIGEPAAAQSTQGAGTNSAGSSGLETVVVTARKRLENIQSVPQTVTAIDAATIINSHLTSLEDLNSFATNLNIVERADNTPDVTLRGVGAFGVVQGVGFYVNDVQQFEGQTVRPIDIDSIEVLKGPQGTLYGGASTGGAIKYTTKLPTDELTAEATAEYGTQNTETLEGAISGPIVPDQLLGRLSLFTTNSGGYIRDTYLQKTLTGPREEGGRLTLEYLDGPTTIRFYFSGDHTSSESMNLYYAPASDQAYSYDVTLAFVPTFVRELYSPTLQIDHEFAGATLTSITSYFHSFIRSDADLSKNPVPVVSYIQNFNRNVWTEELRLASTDDSAFKWLLGAFAQGQDSYTAQQQIVEPSILDYPDAFSHNEESYAVFGNVTYDLNPWSFEGGLRLAYYDNRMLDKTLGLGLPPTLFGSLTVNPDGNPNDPPCAPCAGQVKRVEAMPMASVSYHFTEDDMAYLTVSRGFEPADLNDEPLTNLNNPNPTCMFAASVGVPCQQDVVHSFKPEYVLSNELGVKSTLLDDRLRLNGDVFYLVYDNRLFEVGKFIGSQISTFEENLGTSHNYGLELDAEYLPIDELTLSAGLGTTRSVFVGGTITTVTNGLTNVSTVVNVKGRETPNYPSYQITLAADWHHPVTDDLTFGARVSARLLGQSWWDGLNQFQQQPYQIVDAGLRLEYGEHWTLAGNVKNLLGAKYNTFYADLTQTGAPYNVAGIGAPREAFVSLTVRY
jgi:iron complex outermembrane receptor protein